MIFLRSSHWPSIFLLCFSLLVQQQTDLITRFLFAFFLWSLRVFLVAGINYLGTNGSELIIYWFDVFRGGCLQMFDIVGEYFFQIASHIMQKSTCVGHKSVSFFREMREITQNPLLLCREIFFFWVKNLFSEDWLYCFFFLS